MNDKKYITRDQVDEITNSIPRLRDKAIFQTAYFGGLRLKELVELRRGDLDFKKDFVEINVSTGLSDRKIIVVEPKETLEEYIEKYDISDDTECLWQSPDGSKMSTNVFMYEFREICDSVDLDFSSYDLRRSRQVDLIQEKSETAFNEYFGYAPSSSRYQLMKKVKKKLEEGAEGEVK